MRPRIVAVLASITLAGAAAAAEVTRTVEATLDSDIAAPFAVENLAGTMTITAADVERVEAVATVHAEDEALAAEVRLEKVTGARGVPTLLVRYPVDRIRTFRYPGHGTSEAEYDGHRVRVSRSRGELLFADVEVRVPRRSVQATFRNHVGKVRATGVAGRVALDTGSGDIEADGLDGEINADTGSGAVLAEGLKGSFACDTGSGECRVTDFSGEEVWCETGSGGIDIERVAARRVRADTGSGAIAIAAADVEEVRADTGSGRIQLAATGSRLRRVVAETGSGSVTLALPRDASFELLADQGSGDLECGFEDAQAIVRSREVVGYRRGAQKIRIDVDTGSGSVRVVPAG